jgi:hypothetical protein
MIAMYCSASLRLSDFSGVRKKFLTSCCVSVLPPTRYFLSPRRFVMTAPIVRMMSTPGGRNAGPRWPALPAPAGIAARHLPAFSVR